MGTSSRVWSSTGGNGENLRCTISTGTAVGFSSGRRELHSRGIQYDKSVQAQLGLGLTSVAYLEAQVSTMESNNSSSDELTAAVRVFEENENSTTMRRSSTSGKSRRQSQEDQQQKQHSHSAPSEKEMLAVNVVELGSSTRADDDRPMGGDKKSERARSPMQRLLRKQRTTSQPRQSQRGNRRRGRSGDRTQQQGRAQQEQSSQNRSGGAAAPWADMKTKMRQRSRDGKDRIKRTFSRGSSDWEDNRPCDDDEGGGVKAKPRDARNNRRATVGHGDQKANAKGGLSKSLVEANSKHKGLGDTGESGNQRPGRRFKSMFGAPEDLQLSNHSDESMRDNPKISKKKSPLTRSQRRNIDNRPSRRTSKSSMLQHSPKDKEDRKMSNNDDMQHSNHSKNGIKSNNDDMQKSNHSLHGKERSNSSLPYANDHELQQVDRDMSNESWHSDSQDLEHSQDENERGATRPHRSTHQGDRPQSVRSNSLDSSMGRLVANKRKPDKDLTELFPSDGTTDDDDSSDETRGKPSRRLSESALSKEKNFSRPAASRRSSADPNCDTKHTPTMQHGNSDQELSNQSRRNSCLLSSCGRTKSHQDLTSSRRHSEYIVGPLRSKSSRMLQRKSDRDFDHPSGSKGNSFRGHSKKIMHQHQESHQDSNTRRLSNCYEDEDDGEDEDPPMQQGKSDESLSNQSRGNSHLLSSGGRTKSHQDLAKSRRRSEDIVGPFGPKSSKTQQRKLSNCYEDEDEEEDEEERAGLEWVLSWDTLRQKTSQADDDHALDYDEELGGKVKKTREDKEGKNDQPRTRASLVVSSSDKSSIDRSKSKEREKKGENNDAVRSARKSKGGKEFGSAKLAPENDGNSAKTGGSSLSKRNRFSTNSRMKESKTEPDNSTVCSNGSNVTVSPAEDVLMSDKKERKKPAVNSKRRNGTVSAAEDVLMNDKKESKRYGVYASPFMICTLCFCYGICLCLVGALGFGVHMHFFANIGNETDGKFYSEDGMFSGMNLGLDSSHGPSHYDNSTPPGNGSSAVTQLSPSAFDPVYIPPPSPSPSSMPSSIPSVSLSSDPSSPPSLSMQPSVSSLPSSSPITTPSTRPSMSYLPSVSPSRILSTQPSLKPSYLPSFSPTTILSMQPSAAPSYMPSSIPTTEPMCPEQLLKSITLDDDELLKMRYDVVLYEGSREDLGGLLCISLEYAGAAGWMGIAFSEARRNPQFGRKEAIIGIPGIRTGVAVATDGDASLGQQVFAEARPPAFANPGKYEIPAGGIEGGFSGPSLSLLSDIDKQTLTDGSVSLANGYLVVNDAIADFMSTTISFVKYLREPGEIEIDPYGSTLLLYAVAPFGTDGAYDGNPQWKYTYLNFLDDSPDALKSGPARKRKRKHDEVNR